MNVTPPVEIAAWLGCLYFVVGLYNASTKAWFNLRGKPTPIEQQEATQGIATRVSRLEVCQCEQLRRLDGVDVEARHMREEHEEGARRLRELLSAEIDKVFRRVNAVADSSSVMTGELKGIQMQLAMLLNRRR